MKVFLKHVFIKHGLCIVQLKMKCKKPEFVSTRAKLFHLHTLYLYKYLNIDFLKHTQSENQTKTTLKTRRNC